MTLTSIPALASALTKAWQPIEIAAVNDTQLRLARLDGEFPWHVHETDDELFLCWSGTFRIEVTDRQPVNLQAGDVFVVPAGTSHRPVADAGPAYAVLIERPETRQYGDRGADS